MVSLWAEMVTSCCGMGILAVAIIFNQWEYFFERVKAQKREQCCLLRDQLVFYYVEIADQI